jgi:excisionase family DNA binding protein
MSTRVTFTPKEAAGVLGVSVAYLYKAMGRGELATLKFGARRLIHRDDLESYIAANRETQHVRAARPVDEVNRQRLLTKAA